MDRPFGLIAEGWTIEMLRSAGVRVRRATGREDHAEKIDFWVWSKRFQKWLPIQFTVDKEAAMSWKGSDSLKRGVVVSWLSDRKLSDWANSHSADLQKDLAGQFWNQVEGLVQGSPCLKRQYAKAA